LRAATANRNHSGRSRQNEGGAVCYRKAFSGRERDGEAVVGQCSALHREVASHIGGGDNWTWAGTVGSGVVNLDVRVNEVAEVNRLSGSTLEVHSAASSLNELTIRGISCQRSLYL